MVFIQQIATRLAMREQPERGAGLVEYALLIGLIAVVCVAAVAMLGDSTNAPIANFGSQLGK